jgi:serine/threonine protein phosphatase 1
MPKTYVIGDIHGACKALRQCLERSRFDYDNDVLISLGDVCDGWPETRQCIDELMKIKNLVYVFGNHDMWTLEWMQTGDKDEIWLSQGGEAMLVSANPQEAADLLVALANEAGGRDNITAWVLRF